MDTTIGMKEAFSVAAGVLILIAFVPYAYSIVKSRLEFARDSWVRSVLDRIVKEDAKPMKASWIIWASLDTITLGAMAAKHSLNGQIVGAVAGGWIIVVLAFKYGIPGWTRLDKFCLGGAVLGITFWAIFNNPVMGLATSVSVVFLGSFPTFASAWRDPSKESKVAWTIFWISCVFAVLAIPQLTIQDAMQPITFLVIESAMMFILFIKPRLPKTKPSPAV